MLLITALAVLVWSGVNPNGRFNWMMEVLPAIVGGAILVITYRRFPFTTVTYVIVWLFALILMVGGHYTYAEVPIGNWARDAFGWSRNHYDRMGRVMQGVVPAVIAREILLRTSSVRRGRWLPVLCVSLALSVSACYELFEWRYAVMFGGERASDFLGSQGDIWDAQQDMAMALIGAILAMLLLSRLQNRQMAALARGK